MPPKVKFHDVNPFIQTIRNFLLGRNHTLALRFQDTIATRSPPPPVIPDGPSHRLSANYYVNRDARREVAPPEQLAPKPKELAAGGEESAVKMITPGKVYKWD